MQNGLVNAEPMTTHPGSDTALHGQSLYFHRDALVKFASTVLVDEDRDGRSKSGAGARSRTLTRRTGKAPDVTGLCTYSQTIERAEEEVELGALRPVEAASTGAPRTWNLRCFVDHYEGHNDRMTVRTQGGSESPHPACLSPNTDLGLGRPSGVAFVISRPCRLLVETKQAQSGLARRAGRNVVVVLTGCTPGSVASEDPSHCREACSPSGEVSHQALDERCPKGDGLAGSSPRAGCGSPRPPSPARAKP